MFNTLQNNALPAYRFTIFALRAFKTEAIGTAYVNKTHSICKHSTQQTATSFAATLPRAAAFTTTAAHKTTTHANITFLIYKYTALQQQDVVTFPHPQH